MDPRLKREEDAGEKGGIGRHVENPDHQKVIERTGHHEALHDVRHIDPRGGAGRDRVGTATTNPSRPPPRPSLELTIVFCRRLL